MYHCNICKKKISSWGICHLCKTDPFKVEIFRDNLSKKDKYYELKNTYTKKYGEIENINTKIFWNLKYLNLDNMRDQTDHMTRNKFKDILLFLKSKKGKLLDIGIGLGNLEKMLITVNKNIQLFGIDTSNISIKINRKALKGKFQNASIFKIPFSKHIFDIVVCLEVFEHISPSKLFLAFREINKVIKRGGIFIISVPLNEGLEELLNTGVNPNCHVRIYTYSIIKSELKMFGFNIIKVKYYFAFKKYYFIKDFLIRYLFKYYRKPNNLLIFSIKK